MPMNNSQQFINGIANFGTRSMTTKNTPTQYVTREKQYLADRTEKFAQNRAYLATDYVTAMVQGLTESFYEFTPTTLRLADIAAETATSTKKSDDYKQILFDDESIDYIPIGAKVVTMGNTWIVTNPANMSTANTTAIIARCNASYNSYDEYGNVITEPIVVLNRDMHGNNNTTPHNMVLMDGNFNVLCQLNDNTRKLGINKRIILGTKPYFITGFADFIQEFSGERGSVHLLNFTARIEEPTENDDVTENFIADGKTFSFEGAINGINSLNEGESYNFSAVFTANGNEVENTEQTPVTWDWGSTDKSVAQVNKDGEVTAKSVGSTFISARLQQNPNIVAVMPLQVTAVNFEPYVAFKEPLPEVIKQYNTETFWAAYFNEGAEENQPLQWSFDGADEKAYTVVYGLNGKSVTIYCVHSSKTPLTITASYGEYSASTTVELMGY